MPFSGEWHRACKSVDSNLKVCLREIFGEVFMGPLVKTIAVLALGVIGIIAMEVAIVVKLIGEKGSVEDVQCLEARDH